ncbi:hypothetical protein RAL01_002424 [Vibrio vulnificus]|uniref:hypothetical protein n=1 Tax=Vibrio vulnificus TaxID=672 RepID=UPI0013EEB83D|nr:hypothetical protein [Vibrio vulnificus]EGS1994392.1 hypothetical protein [Vibrio vulnificus]EHK9066808.1 hypothetical protein [Vibrio vulnificus]EHU4801965.1 hypothetical protein [Vibrio vulnificus]EHV9835167.1 hypothetical protein [Vibrio vulnificus]EIA0804364.1 hypothetical protein [Vibrio vulnificus]
MDSRVHGNDDWRFGGGVLSFYVRVPLLMCLVSSHPLLLQHLPYHFGLSASFYPVSRHPREGGDPSYSKLRGLVIPLHCQCCCLVVLCCCLLRRVRVQMRHPECVDEWIPVCTGMTIGGVVAVF